MRWSWRIARIAGIGIYVHATFPLLLVWIALVQYRAVGSAAATLVAIVLVLAVFGLVVLHELGHALTARRFGIATRDITLLPIGGIARLERMPRVPKQELLIALAGPAVNVVLAILLYGALFLFGGAPTPGELLEGGRLTAGRLLVAELAWTNVILAGFNLIPAFPMDGGRVLRALIAMRTHDFARATETAARVGRFFALAFGLLGLFVLDQPLLVLVALFVWLGAAGEASAVQASDSLAGVAVAEVMIRDVRTLAPGDPLARAVQLTLDGFQQDFPVVDDAGVVGLLTRRDLFKALAEHGPHLPVSGVMRRDIAPVDPADHVDEALTRLRACDCQALPVVRDQRLLGVLSLDNVREFVMARTAMREAAG